MRKLSSFLGDGLLTSDGDKWKRQRRLAAPVFHPKATANLGPLAAARARAAFAPQAGGLVDINALMGSLALSIAAGTQVVCPSWAVHQDPRWWRDPLAFRPERWLEGTDERPDYTFFPFGGGPRTCIGQRMATTEAIAVLAAFAERFDVSIEDTSAPQLVPGVTLRPSEGLRVILHPRAT